MSKKTRIIILSILAILIVVVLSIGITTAFMKPVEQGGNLTEISLSSCAKIKLTGTSSVNLSNSYPMSRNRGFQTTPYSFTVTSYCETFVGFNLYIATLNTNTIEASNIRYILTSKGSKEVVSEGLLSEATNGDSDFDDALKTELNAGLKGTYGNIYKIYNDSISLKGNKEYDLYLFVDENATNTTMGKTFSAGVAVKAYDREPNSLGEFCGSGENLGECIINFRMAYGNENSKIFYHNTYDSTLSDDSYRFFGASEDVENFVCFGSNESPCPKENLYRIIGLFYETEHGVAGQGLVKLIKYYYATKEQLGTIGYEKSFEIAPDYSDVPSYKGYLSQIDLYFWDESDISATSSEIPWDQSTLYSQNLELFLNTFSNDWIEKIQFVDWKLGGEIIDEDTDNAFSAFNKEFMNTNSENNISAYIGLMYLSDFVFASNIDSWSKSFSEYREADANIDNWISMGFNDWTIPKYIINEIKLPVYIGNLIETSAVRPTFYLVNSVSYVSGSGTISDPIRIN